MRIWLCLRCGRRTRDGRQTMAHGTCDFAWVVRHQDASGRICGGAREVP